MSYTKTLVKNIFQLRMFNLFFRNKGKRLLISRKSVIKGRRRISLGNDVTVNEMAKLHANSGELTLGNKCYVDRNVLISTHGGSIQIGDRCSFNPNCCIYGHGGLKIGNFVRIAAGTTIIPSNHGFERIDVPICDQKGERKGIVIEDDVWIGSNCTILDGVTIGKSSIIGAGSVVTKSIEPFSIVGGVPAKLIRKRN